jgi:hypothetical protein
MLGRFEDSDGRNLGYLWVLDRDPSGQFVAMQADVFIRVGTTRVGVWEAVSGKLVWEPEDTLALCWSPDAREVWLIRDHYEPSPDHPPMIVSPLQSEYTYFFERRTWPDKRLIHRCVIRPPTGWFDHVVASPRGNLAAVRWIEQDRAGFVLVSLDHDVSEQIPTAKFRAKHNTVKGPIFSPDGRYLVLSCGDWQAPSTRRGRCRLGWVWVYDTETDTAREIVVEDDLPPGWPPGG